MILWLWYSQPFDLRLMPDEKFLGWFLQVIIVLWNLLKKNGAYFTANGHTATETNVMLCSTYNLCIETINICSFTFTFQVQVCTVSHELYCHQKLLCTTTFPVVWWFTASCLLVQARRTHLKTTQALTSIRNM